MWDGIISSTMIRAKNLVLLLVVVLVVYITDRDCMHVSRGVVGKLIHKGGVPVLLITKTTVLAAILEVTVCCGCESIYYW